MLYVRGSLGTALVRVEHLMPFATVQCTILNDGSVHQLRRDTDANFLADLKLLEQAISVFSGPPAIVSGASELD